MQAVISEQLEVYGKKTESNERGNSMSILCVNLEILGQSTITLNLNTQLVIETTLTVTPEFVSLPTLISVENIIEQINEIGFELSDKSEMDRIASLINNYYIPTPKASWQNKNMDIRVIKISISPEQYKELKNIRSSVKKMVQDVNYYERKGDSLRSKNAQDEAVMTIARSVEKKPSWWKRNRGKLIKFIAKTAIGVLIDITIGIPLGTLVRSILR